MKNIIRFSLPIDYMEIAMEDKYLMILDAYLVSVGLNRHKSYIGKETIQAAIPSLANKPIVCIYGASDFKEHARTDYDKRYKEHCVGNIPESNGAEFVEHEGKTFLKCRIIIWKLYAPQAVEIFSLAESKQLSIEISVEDEDVHIRDDGYEEVDKFQFQGICLVGDSQTPAIDFAKAEIVRFTVDNNWTDNTLFQNHNRLYSLVNKSYLIPQESIQCMQEALTTASNNIELVKFASENNKSLDMSIDGVENLAKLLHKFTTPSDRKFLGGERIVKWCQEILDEKGGLEMEVENTVGQEQNPEITQFTVEGDAPTDAAVVNSTPEVPTDNIDKFTSFQSVISQLGTEINREIPDGYCYSSCWYSDADESYVYIYDWRSGLSYRLSYSVVNDIVKIDWSTKVEVVCVSTWKVKSENPELVMMTYDAAREMVTSMESQLTTLTAEKSEISTTLSDIQQKFTVLETEKGALEQFKNDQIKKEVQGKANMLFAQYNSYIGDEDLKEFNIVLETSGFETLQEKVRAFVAPKIEAELAALKQRAVQTPEGNAIDNPVRLHTVPLVVDQIQPQDKQAPKSLLEMQEALFNKLV